MGSTASARRSRASGKTCRPGVGAAGPSATPSRFVANLALASLLLGGCQAAVEPAGAPPRQPSIAAGLILPSAEARPAAETHDGSSDSVVLASANADAGWIAAADRQFGLRIYALDGREVSAFGVGSLRDIDAVRVADDEYVLAASNATAQAVNLFRAAIADGVLTVTPMKPMPLALAEPHGLCMERVGDRLRVYVADGDGRLEEWHIDADGFGSLVRWFSFPTRTEGCVVDRPARRLFVGEGGVGIWSLAEPRAAVRVSPNAQVGIDGLPMTGGVAVTSMPLPGHPLGIVIFHDGSARGHGFKMADWRVVQLLLDDPAP